MFDISRITKARNQSFSIFGLRHTFVVDRYSDCRRYHTRTELRALEIPIHSPHNFTMKSSYKTVNALQPGRKLHIMGTHHVLYFKSILCVINVFNSPYLARYIQLVWLIIVTLALTSDFFTTKYEVILRNNFSYINENNNREIYSDMLSEYGSELSITDILLTTIQSGVIGRGRSFENWRDISWKNKAN